MSIAELETFARSTLLWLADAALRGAVLAAIVAVGVILFRVGGAANRLAAWRLVLAAALVMPIAGFLLPELLVPVPSFSDASAGMRAMTPLSTIAAGATQATGPSAMPIALIAFAIYAVGVIVLGIRAFRGWRAVRRLERAAVDARTPFDVLADHSQRLGLARVPRLIEVPDRMLSVPVTFGVRRPAIVLPVSWQEWPPSKLEAVLIHELSHIGRRDALTQHLAIAVRAIFWPSPLGWWLRRHVSRLAEQASDEAALAGGVEPARYAGILLGFMVSVRNRARRPEWHLAMARTAGAERRVEHVLAWKGSPMSMSPRLSALLTAGAVGLVAIVSAVRPLTVSAAPVALPDAPVWAIQLPPPPPPPPAPPEPPPPPPPPTGSEPQYPPPPPPTPPPPGPPQGPPPPPPPPPPPDWQVYVPDDDFAKDTYSMPGTVGLVAPIATNVVQPKYTSDTMRAKIQGMVVVQIIVDVHGSVEKARVIRGLHPDLDEQALVAAKQWAFKPGTLDGRAVPVSSVLMLEFRLH